MVARARSQRSDDFLAGRRQPVVSERCQDRALVLRLFEAHTRALGVSEVTVEQWVRAADAHYGTPDEPGGVACIRAVLAVEDGFPASRVTRGFPEGRI